MMTSTLAREQNAELDILVLTQQLRRIEFDEFAAVSLLSNALTAQRSARSAELNLMERFVMAHEGIYALCLGVLYLHSVLPTGLVGHRALAIHVACELMGLPHRIKDQILYLNTHLELMAHGSTEPVEEQEIADLMDLGQKTVVQARYMFPDWFI